MKSDSNNESDEKMNSESTTDSDTKMMSDSNTSYSEEKKDTVPELKSAEAKGKRPIKMGKKTQSDMYQITQKAKGLTLEVPKNVSPAVAKSTYAEVLGRGCKKFKKGRKHGDEPDKDGAGAAAGPRATRSSPNMAGPVKIVLDTNVLFLFKKLKGNKADLLSALNKFFSGTVEIITTSCLVQETFSRFGDAGLCTNRVAVSCVHKETVGSEECILHLFGQQNPFDYLFLTKNRTHLLDDVAAVHVITLTATGSFVHVPPSQHQEHFSTKWSYAQVQDKKKDEKKKMLKKMQKIKKTFK